MIPGAAVAAPLLSLGLAVAAGPAGPRPEYLDLLRGYARGERPQAVAGLGSWSQRDQERQLGEVQRLVVASERCRCKDPLAGVPLRAAVMLHADRDEAEQPEAAGPEQPRHCPGPQAKLAARYAALLSRVPEHADFARRSFVALAQRAQWDNCLEDAQRFGNEGLQAFPRDAPLLLVVGASYEEGAALGMAASRTRVSGLPSGQRDDDRVSQRERQRWMAEARRNLDAAVAADPANLLARLRQGRVLQRQGELEPSRQALALVVQGSSDPALLFLAHLFLGRAHEQDGHAAAAAAEYRLALQQDEKAQSAAVALAHALQLTGEPAEARTVLEHAMAASGRRSGRDVFWDYLVGDAGRAEALFDALRRESLE